MRAKMRFLAKNSSLVPVASPPPRRDGAFPGLFSWDSANYLVSPSFPQVRALHQHERLWLAFKLPENERSAGGDEVPNSEKRPEFAGNAFSDTARNAFATAKLTPAANDSQQHAMTESADKGNRTTRRFAERKVGYKQKGGRWVSKRGLEESGLIGQSVSGIWSMTSGRAPCETPRKITTAA